MKGGDMRTLAWIGVGPLFMMTMAACGGGDQGKSYLLRHAVVTLSQAANIAEVNGPGRAVGVELGQSGNRVFHDVEIIDAVNKTRRLRIDAESGKVVKELSF